MSIDHVILTRFNLPSRGAESVVRAQDGWLRERVVLFERYCLPSVRTQTTQNFSWLVYFDPESPDWLLDRIRTEWAGAFSPRFREEVSRENLVADIRSVLGETQGQAYADTLLTTNLDNDDGLAHDFVERLQAAPIGQGQTAVYLVNGLIRRAADVYRRTDRSNAFCSVAEPWTAPQTCWVDWHNTLHERMPVVEIAGKPAWLQVVHEKNVSNKVHGVLTSPEPARALFGELLAGTSEPGAIRLAADSYLARPARTVTTAARRAAKFVALRLVGRSGLDAIKLRLAALRK